MPTFNSNILVADATNPPLVNAPLSSTGVTFISGNNVEYDTVQVTWGTVGPTVAGFAFNSISLSATPANKERNLVSFPIAGTTVWVPKAMNGSEFALILKPINNIQRSVLVQYVSGAAESNTPTLSSFSADVMGPNQRRLYLYGYI